MFNNIKKLPVQLPRVRCTLCDKPVDSVTYSINGADASETLVVCCHGDREEMRVTHSDLASMGPEEYARNRPGRIEGIAFATKRLA